MPQLAHFAHWKPTLTYEDQLLHAYWEAVGGLLFAEVRFGQGGLRSATYPAGTKPRRIDGVRIVAPPPPATDDILTFHPRTTGPSFETQVQGATVEVIEVKPVLNRTVIGQAIVGAELLRMEYTPGPIQQVIVCGASDPLLAQVCTRLAITVYVVPPAIVAPPPPKPRTPRG